MNAFFQIMNSETGTGLRVIPTRVDEQPIVMSELISYLTYHKVPFELSKLNKAVSSIETETIIPLTDEKVLPIQEELILEVSDDRMTATARFYPPSNDGSVMSVKDILSTLQLKKIVYGVNQEAISSFTTERKYFDDIVIAEGTSPRQGADAYIEYFFNTDLRARPTLKEDGSVDFFNLNIVNHCRKGDILARLYPADKGDYGTSLLGDRIKPREVKAETLKFSRNIELSPDRLLITSLVNGHVTLVDGKVFVNDLLEVENVDNSTGNIDYEGNVKVNGNVCANFKLHAQGNVEVQGIVEGAEIVSGGNIIIIRGVSGMGKGTLTAEGNVVARFIENATVTAKGYVESESILHSKVMAGTEVHVNGKIGFITGGYVSATNLIEVKTLGSAMGADTIVEVGINPAEKQRLQMLQQKVKEESKSLQAAQPVLETAAAKLSAGKTLPPEQMKYIKDLAALFAQKKAEVETLNQQIKELEMSLSASVNAQVIVLGEVHPGTKIGISDVSMIVKSGMKYCRFIKQQGDVKMVGI